MLYFDTSYLVRLYLDDAGADLVRSLAEGDDIACSLHGRIETVAAFHRVHREKRLSRVSYLALLDQFDEDEAAGAFSWLPIAETLLHRIQAIYRKASADLFLRAADALHLASAQENGFTAIYSHDERMLAAAPLFSLKGKNVLPRRR